MPKEYQQTVYNQHPKIYTAISRRDAVMEHLAFIVEGLRKQTSAEETAMAPGNPV